MPPSFLSPILSRPPLKWLAKVIVLAAIYIAIGHFTLSHTSVDGHYTGFWPVAGVSIAVLYLFGLNLWPAIFAGAMVVNFLAHTPLGVSGGIAAGNTLEALLGAWLLRRSKNFSPRIGKLNDALQVIFYAGLLASLCSAIFGTASLVIGGLVRGYATTDTFLLWWTGNILGTLVMTPTILAWANPGRQSFTLGRKIECAVGFVLGASLSWIIFTSPQQQNYFGSLPFLMFFFVTWAALRFSQRVATAFVLVVAVITVWGTLHGFGPFQTASSGAWGGTQEAQMFIIVCAVVSMLVSATTTNLFARSQHLENSERRYRELFNSGPDPLWIYSPQTQKIVAVNEAAIKRLGFSREEFLQLNVSELLVAEVPTSSPSPASKPETSLASLKTKSGDKIQVRLTVRSADFFGESAIHFLAQDVTEQMRTEDDLRKSEQKLNLHIQQTALGVIEWNQNFEITEWNPAAERIFGFSKEEAIGKLGQELIVPENVRENVAKVWGKIVDTVEPVRSINENITKNGDRIVCEWFNTPLADKKGHVIGAASLVQDVTLRESIKESVRESEEKFRSVIESSPMGIQIYEMRDGEDLILIGANPAAQNFMGFENEAVLGKTIEEAFPALSGTEIPRMYRRAAGEGKASWTDQVLYDGGELRAAYEVNAFQTVPGKMVAMFLDVTERRRTEQALRLRDKAMEAISQGIVIMARHPDGSFPIIYANPAFEKITHYTHDQLLGQNWRVLTGSESEISEVEAIEKAIIREQPVSVEMRSYRQDGTIFQSAISLSPIVDADGRVSHYVAVYTDITSIKKLETQFRQSQKMEAIGRLAGGVAHDFNNLLTAIIGYNDINLSMIERDTMLSRNSAEIQKAAERAASLTGQMLAFSRQQNLQPTRVALNKSIGGMYQMLARLIGETIEIRTLLDDSLADIKAGSSQIEQVILNLAINARDAMPEGGVLSIRTANVTVGPDLVADIPGIIPGDYVLLSLSDNGTGMDDHTKEHLFEPFFTTKEKGKGTGLGLATCYGIITQSNGYVAVHSKLGRGSTFDVYFPKMISDGARETNRIADVKVQGGKETLLVVEDDPAVRPLTTNILRSLGYTVLEAGNGIEAQDCLKTVNGTKIDLLLTDVVMPKMGGKELADWMKITYPETKILFASGYLENMLSREDIGEDEAYFLRKPFTARTLARKVRAVLDQEEDSLIG
ncbi:MAG: PAS domain S-box protein [Chthoniobacterales bacterium]